MTIHKRFQQHWFMNVHDPLSSVPVIHCIYHSSIAGAVSDNSLLSAIDDILRESSEVSPVIVRLKLSNIAGTSKHAHVYYNSWYRKIILPVCVKNIITIYLILLV